MKKLIRITTVPISLSGLLTGQLSFMKNHYDIIGISSGGKGLEHVKKQEGIPVIPVEMTRSITPLKDLKALISLYKVLKKEKPFIIHSHTPKAGTLGMIAAKMAGVPHRLHTIAGMPLLEATGIKRVILNYVEKITYKCATKIYPNSHGLNTIILDNNFTQPSKLKVLGNGSSNGIDTDYFNPSLFDEKSKKELRDSLGIKKEDYVFIFVGRLVSDKGINELIKAFEKIDSQEKNVKLLLVGTFEKELDPLKKETEDYIINAEHLIGVGWKEDVRAYFSIANCLVFPSYREGFPNVVMQAGAMGLPSIVSNINGCNEIIINGENGFIIPPKSVDELYEKMILLFKQKENIFCSQECRNLIVTRYNRKFIWNEILKEYKALEKQ